MIPTITTILLLLLAQTKIKSQSTNSNKLAYDYIIIGSGAGGGTLSADLSLKGYQVLLIEAGPEYHSTNITVPGLHTQSIEDPNISWEFYTKRYKTETLKSQQTLYPKASGLGGCTIHNAMIHLLPNTRDYLNLIKITGDNNWSKTNMLKYYNRMTKSYSIDQYYPLRSVDRLGKVYRNLKTKFNDYYYSNSNSDEEEGLISWLRLTRLNVINLLAKDNKLLDIIYHILGKPLLKDLTGFDINYISTNEKSTATIELDRERNFFLPSNVDNTNLLKRTGLLERLVTLRDSGKLTIWTDTLATKILLDDNNTAYGVNYLKGRRLYRASKGNSSPLQTPGTVYATREIIISAGTFNTPQLMMLSGIGDSNQLKKFNIKTKINLPGVGRNLHDRYEIGLNYKFRSKFTVLDQCLFKGDRSDPCFNNFIDYQSGPYTFNGILSALTKKSHPKLTEPDLVTMVAPIYFTGYHNGMGDDIYNNKDVLSFLILKAHTLNRSGRVKLISDDPRDMVDINFNYFSNGADHDLRAMIKAIKEVRSLAKLFLTNATEIIPGYGVQSDNDLINYIKDKSWGHHATGTMKIGRDNDKLAVLDGQFRVRGVNRLRVVDLSIFPDIPGYFPVLFLYMVGSKAADDIDRDSHKFNEPSPYVPSNIILPPKRDNGLFNIPISIVSDRFNRK